MKRPWYFKLQERLWGLAESICISFCASVATFPVLVLRGLSVSIYAVASSVAVLWLIQPIMLLGLGTAFAGLVPALAPLYGVLSAASAALTGLLDRWAVWISACCAVGIDFYLHICFSLNFQFYVHTPVCSKFTAGDYVAYTQSTKNVWPL